MADSAAPLPSPPLAPARSPSSDGPPALLDGAPQRELDALVALAAEMLGTPAAMLTMVDGQHQRVQARAGLPMDAGPRDLAWCERTLGANELTVVPDAADPAAAAPASPHPAGTVRFFAGMPIRIDDSAGDRRPVGVLCVLDETPRSLDTAGAQALRHLATLAEAMIAARITALRAIDIATEAERLASDLAQQDRLFRQAERMAMIGSWRVWIADQRIEWSEGVARIHGLPVDHAPQLREALNYYPVSARRRVAEALARTMATGEPFEIEEDLHAADGRVRRVRSHAELEMADGAPIAVIGMFQDITERHALEMALRRNADTDGLTGLPNRAAFDRELNAAMRRAQVHGLPLMLALIDLDGFKTINDTLGHTTGDDVLRGIGEALRESWLATSFPARLGGDEFAVIVSDPALTDDPVAFREQLEATLCRPVRAGNLQIASGGTVGVALLDEHTTTVRDFVHRADTILYVAKRARVGHCTGDRRRAGGR